MHPFRRTAAGGSALLRIDGAPLPHGDDHPRNLRKLHLFQKLLLQLLRRAAFIVLGKEKPRLLLIADDAVGPLQKIPPLHRDGHIGDHRIDLLPILLGKRKDLLQNRGVHIDLQDDTVRPGDDLLPMLFQNIGDFRKIRSPGDRGHDIPLVVEDRKPGPEPALDSPDVVGVHPMALELPDHIRPHASLIHNADKGRPKLHIRDVLRHVPAHAPVHLYDAARIFASGDVLRKRIALHIHKDRTEDHDSQPFGAAFRILPFSLSVFLPRFLFHPLLPLFCIHFPAPQFSRRGTLFPRLPCPLYESESLRTGLSGRCLRISDSQDSAASSMSLR